MEMGIEGEVMGWRDLPAGIRLLPCHACLDGVAAHYYLAETHDAGYYGDETDREYDDERRWGAVSRCQNQVWA